ncbi:hypothetical protein [Palleronia sp. LCG004]|uniref:hypothetical protein n=1 Tax=Palleronia sp. LCG004 TaxID=3079304 RepID=UPI002941D8FF|nr:hypothetical protein [Palleronia sp. LCG004]WOI55107.1 hypothetical protein RVY76_08535 [Palleronia sp. LCG004]
MPLDKFVMILVIVIIGGGITVAIAAAVQANIAPPVRLAALIPGVLATYIVLHFMARRAANRDDDRQGRTPR